ncbi:MAG: hypothetical protein OQL20_12350 [Sedimenticola sp.]|nr:hypothetical protein [Sedimenticola sp.]
MSRLAVSLYLVLFCSSLVADYPLEIIQLQSRATDEIIPILKPFIEKDGSLAGMNNQLIIRTSPENLAEIKKVLKQLDQPPRSLMILVRQSAAGDASHRRSQADINLMVGKHAKVIVGDRAQNSNSIQYRIRDAKTQSNLDATHRIQVLEGYPAFIATGQSVPVPEQTTLINNTTVHQQITTRYKNITRGFYVVPRLNGERVTLEISPQMNRPGSIQGHYDIQQAHTTVAGYLGEWIQIGGVTDQQQSESNALLRESRTTNHDNRSIELLVQEIIN